MWRRQRGWVLMLVLLGVLMSVVMFISQKGQLNSNSAIWLAYIPAGLLFGGLLLLYRRRNFVEASGGGLKVSNFLSSTVISFDDIRSTRVQELGLHFLEGRKRLIRPLTKPLMAQKALFVRVQGDDEMLARLRRKLGSQIVAGDMIALPIPDPDAMSWEISGRRPERTAVNLGGGKRRRRRGR